VAIADDRQHQFIARDAAMKDRVAPDVGAQGNRDEIGRRAIGRWPALPLAAARWLPQRLEKPVRFAAAPFRVVVDQPRDFVDEPAAVGRGIDPQRTGERPAATAAATGRA
jgi:hypothetical protein